MDAATGESDRDDVVPIPTLHGSLAFGAPDDPVGDRRQRTARPDRSTPARENGVVVVTQSGAAFCLAGKPVAPRFNQTETPASPAFAIVGP